MLVDDISGYVKDPYNRRPILDGLGLSYLSARANIPAALTDVAVLLSKGIFRAIGSGRHYFGHMTDYNSAKYFSGKSTPAYLLCDGYFQNEAELIRFYRVVARELRLSSLSAPRPRAGMPEDTGFFECRDSVGVHLRVDRPGGMPESGANQTEYVARLIARVKEEIWQHRRKFSFRQAVVFSDSEQLVADLVSEFSGYCVGAPRDPRLKPEVNDFRLLANCAKRILTPSTFGWWAAASSESHGIDDCLITLPETSLTLPIINREVA